MNATQKLAAARYTVARKAPYFVGAIQKLIFVPVPGLAAAGDSTGMVVSHHGRLYYDPDVVATTWSIDDVATGLVHDVSHLLRRHHTRRRNSPTIDDATWNQAADVAINSDLAAAGWVMLPTDPVPKTYGLPDGKTAEWYAAHLPTTSRPDQRCGSGAGVASAGEALGDAVAEDLDAPRRGAMELETMRRTVAAAISRAPGSASAHWRVWADAEMKPSRVPWQRILRRATRRAAAWTRGSVDYTYGRMSRRQASVGYGAGSPILAAMHAPVSEALVAIDTSASMLRDSSRPLVEAMSEIKALLGIVASKTTVVAIDAKIQSVVEATTWRAVAAALRGGGGTSFVPLFDYVDALRHKPGIVVVCTDGWGQAPAVAPRGYATIWVLVGDGAQAPCRWGHHVHVHDV